MVRVWTDRTYDEKSSVYLSDKSHPQNAKRGERIIFLPFAKFDF